VAVRPTIKVTESQLQKLFMQVGSQVQTTGCVRGLLSGPAVYTDQRLCNE